MLNELLGNDQPVKEWWLQSDPQRKGWGPFSSEEAAWKYLFGRAPEEDEKQRHMECGWYVGYLNKWPNERGNARHDKA